jgi:Spy/CpxP family protein refolding chaperone
MKTVIASILCTLVVVALAFGQGDQKARPMRGGEFEKLNLSDSQKKDMQKLHSDYAKQKVEQQAKVKTATIDLQQLMKAESPDKATIEKKMTEIANLNVQVKILGIEEWFAVNKMLNPDQQKIWKNTLGRQPQPPLLNRLQHLRERVFGRGHQSQPAGQPER